MVGPARHCPRTLRPGSQMPSRSQIVASGPPTPPAVIFRVLASVSNRRRPTTVQPRQSEPGCSANWTLQNTKVMAVTTRMLASASGFRQNQSSQTLGLSTWVLPSSTRHPRQEASRTRRNCVDGTEALVYGGRKFGVAFGAQTTLAYPPRTASSPRIAYGMTDSLGIKWPEHRYNRSRPGRRLNSGVPGQRRSHC